MSVNIRNIQTSIHFVLFHISPSNGGDIPMNDNDKIRRPPIDRHDVTGYRVHLNQQNGGEK